METNNEATNVQQMRLQLDAAQAIQVDPGMSAMQVKKVARGREYARRWARNNPHKKRCHVLVAHALKWGKLVKPNTCEWCGKEAYLVGHHEDYRKPLKVNWVCDKCHVKHHKTKGR